MKLKKYILLLAISAPLLCSCQKISNSVPSKQENLQNYALGLFYDTVISPTLAMDIAYDLQEFLDLDDQARKYHRFANMVAQYDLNKYAVMFPDALASLVIETGGKDIYTPGAEWNLYIDLQTLLRYYRLESLSDVYLTDTNLCIKCTGLGEWSISGIRSGGCDMVLGEDNILERIWLANTDGVETDARATGIEAAYHTYDVSQSDDYFRVCLQKLQPESSKDSYYLDGVFLVEMSSFGKPKERAFVIGKPGFLINCITEQIVQ